ncbi:tRNA (cytidine(34)-2'-O)-methyltransferase [Mycoplasmopsis bovis]|uniref:tRNA (cytidine(34)-2'-O)-methyltransferase n=1 Tax=Mycoplasmopsis bovis TaxID=28903 RepID=UPI00220A5A1C|nr:tRNA (cytidine(34)-2'-O)-methyltransferase [Mycoplasmopsis bovis]UUA23459.1 tRNA (cytidine(34)-2'-O)-methyltransferase [Mycoplasmopsis bovis]WEI90421.1 tRNA (cytidine(34)-2'-O)-methyltransferase [Mycoplasmopsis bovis]
MVHIVLFEPEIPPNTANIIRTCFAIGAKLHIIKPISFISLDPKYLSRPAAGRLLSDIEHEVHNSYSDFYNKYKDKNIYYITRYGLKTYSDVDFKKEYENNEEIWLMFGKESTGIDKQVLKDNIDNCLRIPMISKMRSINLANCVAIVGFEVMRQIDFKDLSLYESQKGKNFIKEWTKE